MLHVSFDEKAIPINFLWRKCFQYFKDGKECPVLFIRFIWDSWLNPNCKVTAVTIWSMRRTHRHLWRRGLLGARDVWPHPKLVWADQSVIVPRFFWSPRFVPALFRWRICLWIYKKSTRFCCSNVTLLHPKTNEESIRLHLLFAKLLSKLRRTFCFYGQLPSTSSVFSSSGTVITGKHVRSKTTNYFCHSGNRRIKKSKLTLFDFFLVLVSGEYSFAPE